MAWARWSSDNYQCDVYVYQTGDDAYTLHVAAYRPAQPLPPLDIDALLVGDTERYLESVRLQEEAWEATPHVPIGGPHDGESFYDLSLPRLYQLLRELKAEGYHVPDWLLAEVRDELRSYVASCGELLSEGDDDA